MAKFILSKGKVMEQYNKILEFTDKISYSAKTNPAVVPILEKNTDCMFSIHMENELKHIDDLSRVVFLAQAWDEDKIASLLNKNIYNFVVDNERDLNVLEKFLENSDKKINLYLRLRLKEHTIQTERYFVFGMKSEKVNEKIKELRNSEKINVLGVHFHRKTQNIAEWSLKYEISSVLDKESLRMIDEMNIGGGLPSEYANTNPEVIRPIFDKIKEFKSWLEENNIKMVVEPGRFISAPSAKLETSVLSVWDNTVVVDASVYNSDMDAILVPVKLLVEGELPKNEGQAFLIKGCTPCSMDIFRYKVNLRSVKEGDKIYFLNAGAYNFSSDFCDLEKPPTEVVE